MAVGMAGMAEPLDLEGFRVVRVVAVEETRRRPLPTVLAATRLPQPAVADSLINHLPSARFIGMALLMKSYDLCLAARMLIMPAPVALSQSLRVRLIPIPIHLAVADLALALATVLGRDPPIEVAERFLLAASGAGLGPSICHAECLSESLWGLR
jgi:hypothetical protein